MFRLIVVFLLLFGIAHAEIQFEIEKECFNLKDINSSYPDKNLICGMNFGEERKVSLQVIRGYLSKEQANSLPSSNFILVKRKGVEVGEAILKDMIIQELGKKFPSMKFEVVKINVGGKVTASKIENIKLNLPDKPYGTTYIEVDNGVKKYNVYAYIKAFSKGFVAEERINKGESLAGKVKEVEVDITNLKDDLFLNDFGAVAIQNIPKNRVITNKMVKQMPEKLKGEKVKVIYKSDNIVLEFDGVMMEDAYQNQRVSVKNTVSDKVLTGVYRNGMVYIGE